MKGESCAGSASDAGQLALLSPKGDRVGLACAKVDSTALAFPAHMRPIARHLWIEAKPTQFDITIPAETRYFRNESGELGLYAIFMYHADEGTTPQFAVASTVELSEDPEESKHAGTNLADQTRTVELRSGWREAVRLGVPASASEEELWAVCRGAAGIHVGLTAPGLDASPVPPATEGGVIAPPPPTKEEPPPCSEGQVVWGDLSDFGTVPANTPKKIPIPGWPDGAEFSRTGGVALAYTPPATLDGVFYSILGQRIHWEGTLPYVDIAPPVSGTITFDFTRAATTRGERWRFVLGQGGTGGSPEEGPLTIQSSVPLYKLGQVRRLPRLQLRARALSLRGRQADRRCDGRCDRRQGALGGARPLNSDRM